MMTVIDINLIYLLLVSAPPGALFWRLEATIPLSFLSALPARTALCATFAVVVEMQKVVQSQKAFLWDPTFQSGGGGGGTTKTTYR
jgi:hypothetical protein